MYSACRRGSATTVSFHAACPLCDASNSDNFQCGLLGAVQPGWALGTGAHANVSPRCCARTVNAGMTPKAIKQTRTTGLRYRIVNSPGLRIVCGYDSSLSFSALLRIACMKIPSQAGPQENAVTA